MYRIWVFIFIIIFSPILGYLLGMSDIEDNHKFTFLNAWIFTATYWTIYVQAEWISKRFKKL